VLLERVPPERRAHVLAGPPEQVGEGLRPYIEAGFSGFTFNNPIVSTPEAIAAADELLRLVA
jgi:hypothetical protein